MRRVVLAASVDEKKPDVSVSVDADVVLSLWMMNFPARPALVLTTRSNVRLMMAPSSFLEASTLLRFNVHDKRTGVESAVEHKKVMRRRYDLDFVNHQLQVNSG